MTTTPPPEEGNAGEWVTVGPIGDLFDRHPEVVDGRLRVEVPIVDDLPIRELLRRNARQGRPGVAAAPASPTAGRCGRSEEDE